MTAATLVWLESTAPGTAARTHIEGTRQRLAAEGIAVAREVTDSQAGERGLVGRVRRLLRLVLEARRASSRDSVLVTRWHPFMLFVSPLWRRRRRGVVLLVQGNDHTTYEMNPWFRRIPFSGWMMRKSLEAGDRWLVLNEGLREWLVDDIGLAGDLVAVLPTGVSDAFREARGSASAHGRYVVFFGSLSGWQGIEVLLDATRSAAWPEDHRLLIVGSGPLDDVVAAAQSDRVTWLGRRSTDETAAIVAAATVSVCPKLALPSMANTTTPFKILESVAAGVPVVASDIPAQQRMLDADGYGLLAKVGDAEDLARVIRRICSDDALRAELAERARAAGDKLSWSESAASLAATIRQVDRR